MSVEIKKTDGHGVEHAPRVALLFLREGPVWTELQDSHQNGSFVDIRHQNEKGRWTNRTVPEETTGADREDVLDKLRSLPGNDPEGRAAADIAASDLRSEHKRQERINAKETENPAYPSIRLWSPAARRWYKVPRALVEEVKMPTQIRFTPPKP